MAELRSIADLEPHPRNPREIPEAALAGLGQSIGEFGDISGIVWNEWNGKLVCGHQRIRALGSNATLDDGAVVAADGERFPVRVVDWDESKHLAAMVAANSAHIAGQWLPELSGVLDEISVPLGDTFFDLKLDELRGDVPEGVPEAGETDPDDIPDVAEGEPTTKPGDLWVLGDHRLLCGDSTKAEDVERLMGGEKAGAVMTDPPYGIGQPGIPGDESSGHAELVNGAVSLLPITNAACVSFASTRTFPVWLDAIRGAGHVFERMLTLYKEAQCTYPWRGWILISESILVSSIGMPDWQDVKPYHHDAYSVSEVSGELPGHLGWHGSVKPMVVVLDILCRIIREGGNVYDPFLGSGTTLIAAEQLNRKCYGMEIEPKYVDVAVRRWQDFSGKEAVLDGDNRTFAEVATERSDDV